MMHNKLHMSTGNTKLGKTANFNLLPIVTCPEGVWCAKDCYARRLTYSPDALKAWVDNTAFASHDLWGLYDAISEWIKMNKPRFFRWHTSGDVPNQQYAEMMKDTAGDWPDIKFLVFTKRYEIDWMSFGKKIDNLIVYHSAWPVMPMSTKAIRKMYGVDAVSYIEGDKRIPEGTEICSGSCEKCRFCWDAGKDVVLHKH